MKYRATHCLLYSLLGLSLLSCHKRPDEAPAPKPGPGPGPKTYRVRVLVDVKEFTTRFPGVPAINGRFLLQNAQISFVANSPTPRYTTDVGIGWFGAATFDYKLFPMDVSQVDPQNPTLPAGHSFNVRLEYTLDRNQIVQGNYNTTSFKAKVLKRDAATPYGPEETVTELDLPIPTTPGQPGEPVFIAQTITL